ncbi:auxin-responsive protein SAUR32-like [Canna indica]|uniref:Auxin-responsive protein SAUR32-like n=1 Tax=Canna indica TaxID=4628 RepID=A0AAQ3QP46_9LILI|nr:auxin-responsive protein SAUR32-like [Canna indica]
MQQEKRMKVKKGSLAVRVGLEGEEGGFRKFVIPISYLYHPLFRRLLEAAQEAYGYRSQGPLKLPCSVEDFLHLCRRIDRESASSSSSSSSSSRLSHGGAGGGHSFSVYSC